MSDLIVLLSFPMQILEQSIKVGHDQFISRSFKLIIHYYYYY